MASLTEEIGNLVAATNTLTARVEELLNSIESNIDQRIEAALDGLNLVTTVNGIIQQKIATGEIGSSATTLGGYPASDFVRKAESINATTLGGKSLSDLVLKTDSINATSLGGVAAAQYLTVNSTINANTFAGKAITEFVLKTDNVDLGGV